MLCRATAAALFIAAAAPGAADAALSIERRIEHPNGAALLLHSIDFRDDSIVIAAEILNSGDHEVRLNRARTLLLDDGLHGVYPVNPPADNPELRVPAHARVSASLVFVGPLNPAAHRLDLTSNQSVGTEDNPFEDAPVFRAVLPSGAAPGSLAQANHPDGVALRIRGVTASSGSIAIALVATNGSDREVRLDQDDSCIVAEEGGATDPLDPPAADRVLAIPPGMRLEAELVFSRRTTAEVARIVLRTNDGTGGTVDNPYDTTPVFRLSAPVQRGIAAASSRIALVPIARSRLSGPTPLLPAGVAVASTTMPATAPNTAVRGTGGANAAGPIATAPSPAAPPAAAAPHRVAETDPAAGSAAGSAAKTDVPAPIRQPLGLASAMPVGTPPAAATGAAAPTRPAVLAVPPSQAGLRVESTDRGTRIVLPADPLFGSAPDTIAGGGDAMLAEAARLIAANHAREVVIAGHTDGVGRDDDNQALSERRARAVAAWLRAHVGRDPPRFVEQGYGRTRPVAPNHNPDGSDNPQGRAENRRIEIYLRG